MNATHLHLLLNHLPVLGTAFGLGLLLFGLWRTSDELKKTALGVFVLVALAAVPVYLTGEPAEEAVEAFPGVSKSMMEAHEEAAGVAFVSVLVLGVASLGALVGFRRGKRMPAWCGNSVLVAALIVSGLMAYVANLGGQIRHSEIRSGNASPAGSGETQH